MMISERFRIMIGLILVALLLVSCKEDIVATTLPTEVPAPVSDSVGDETSLTGDEESDIDEEKPEPRTELSATNPGSVNLGSGRVTLLEFFAYW